MSDFDLRSIIQEEIGEKRKGILLQRESNDKNKQFKPLTIQDDNENHEIIDKDNKSKEDKRDESKTISESIDSEEEFLDQALRSLNLPLKISESETKRERFERVKRASKAPISLKANSEELKDPMEMELITTSLLVSDQIRTRKLVISFIKRLLNKWKNDLNAQSEDENDQKQYQQQYQTCRNLLNSLFKLLHSDNLIDEKKINNPEHQNQESKGKNDKKDKKNHNEKKMKKSPFAISMELLTCITTICFYMQKREYVKANDMYLRLTIGNATWPIGISMLGIAKDNSSNTLSSPSNSFNSSISSPSFVMAGKREDTKKGMLIDESTRKWIQSLKRLISYCQRAYPPFDSSQLMG